MQKSAGIAEISTKVIGVTFLFTLYISIAQDRKKQQIRFLDG